MAFFAEAFSTKSRILATVDSSKGFVTFTRTLATVGALCVGEYPEAVFVMLFYQVGELFQSYAVDQSRKLSKMRYRVCFCFLDIGGHSSVV